MALKLSNLVDKYKQILNPVKQYTQQVSDNKQTPFFNKGNTPTQWLGKVKADVKKRGLIEGLHDISYPITTNPYVQPILEPLISAARTSNFKAGRPIPVLNSFLGQEDSQMSKQGLVQSSKNFLNNKTFNALAKAQQKFVDPVVNEIKKENNITPEQAVATAKVGFTPIMQQWASSWMKPGALTPKPGVTNPFSLQNPKYNKLGRKFAEFVTNPDILGGKGVTVFDPATITPAFGLIKDRPTIKTGDIANFAAGMLFGNPKETYEGQKAYNKIMNGESLTDEEKEAFNRYSESQMVNLASTFGGSEADSLKGLYGEKLDQAILKKNAFSNINDKKLRFWISDRQATLNKNALKQAEKGGSAYLGNILKHDALYKEYPNARNILVKFDPELKEAVGGFDGQSITLNPKMLGDKGKNKLVTLLHENQHYLQQIEDFATGGNPIDAGQYIFARQELLDQYPLSMDAQAIGKDAYRKLQGEAEARTVADAYAENVTQNTARGRDLLSEQLQKERIKPDELIVKKGGGISSSIPEETKIQIGDTSSEYNVGKNKGDTEILRKAIDEVAPSFEKAAGKPLSHKEIVTAAQNVSEDIIKTIGRAKTEELGAAQLKLRQTIARLSDEKNVTPELLEALQKDALFARSNAQILGQRNIEAVPTTLEGKLKLEMLRKVSKVTDDIEAVANAAKNVDWNNTESVNAFYRQFIKPNKAEWIDAVRYSSMLSSPNTHINNFFSNAQGTGFIAPIEKTITGTLDWLGSSITGKERKYLVGEGAKYAQGYYSNIRNAAKRFADVLTGKGLSDLSLDERNMALTKPKTPARAVENTLKTTQRLLQAVDEFFTVLTSAGEKKALEYKASKGIKVAENVEEASKDLAKKRLFNANLGRKEEGYVLKALEYIPEKIMEARNSSNPVISTIAKYTFPFARVPANILKQSMEYSPLGIATLPGASNKTEQLSKAIMGTAIATATGMLLSSDRITFAEPVSEKQKNAFRAAGMQPYSVKIGNNWYSYTKLHPAISFNLALAAAWKQAHDNKTLNDEELETVLSAGTKWLKFFADQSYMKNMGDLVNATSGELSGFAKVLSNYPQQWVPFRAMMGWIARQVDPYQRQVDPDGSLMQKQLEYFMMQVPGASTALSPRLGLEGLPVENQHRTINAWSPVRISTENPTKKQNYEDIVTQAKIDKEKKDIKENVKKDENTNKYTNDNIDTAAKGFGYDTYLSPKPTGELELKKYKEDVLADARSAYNDKYMDESLKKKLVEKMGYKYQDVEYEVISNKDSVEKAIWVKDLLKGKDTTEAKRIIDILINAKTLSGNNILTSSVAQELGIEDLYKSLKLRKTKYGYVKGTGGTRKAKSLKLKKIKMKSSGKAKVRKLKMEAYKPTTVKKLGKFKPRVNLTKIRARKLTA